MTTYVINPITNELESAQPRQRVADKFKLEDMLTPGPLRDELKEDFDPTQETHEEYLRRINLRYGGRATPKRGLVDGPGSYSVKGYRAPLTQEGYRERGYRAPLTKNEKKIVASWQKRIGDKIGVNYDDLPYKLQFEVRQGINVFQQKLNPVKNPGAYKITDVVNKKEFKKFYKKNYFDNPDSTFYKKEFKNIESGMKGRVAKLFREGKSDFQVRFFPDRGTGKEILDLYNKQLDLYGEPNLSSIARKVFPERKLLDGLQQVSRFLRKYTSYDRKRDPKKEEETGGKRRAKKLFGGKDKISDKALEAELSASRKSGIELQHADALKKRNVTLNNLTYLPKPINAYLSTTEGFLRRKEKEIVDLLKNKPKNYKQKISSLNAQALNKMSLTNQKLVEAGFPMFKDSLDFYTFDENGKPIQLGGRSGQRFGTIVAEQLGLDPNKPIKNFSAQEIVKAREAKNILINETKKMYDDAIKRGADPSSFEKIKFVKKQASQEGMPKLLKALRATKPALKSLPLVGAGIGLYDLGKAVQAGVRNPLDLYAAYEVSADVAQKQKAIREDPTGELLREEIAALPEIVSDDQILDSLGAMQERENFKDGTPPVIPGNEPDYSELQVMLDNPDKYNTFPKGTFTEELDKAVYGTNEERNLLQKFNSMFLDPRVYPYYAQKIASGAANIPELAFRFPASLAYLYGQSNLALATADFDRIRGKTLMEALEILDPKYTRQIKNTKFGDAIGISDKSMNEQDKTEGQKFVGDTFELGAEAVGPATPLFLFKMFPKLPKQIKDLVGTTSAAEKVNKEIEKNLAVDQTKRDLILTIGAGGAVAALKFLGLDKLIKAPKATKAVTSAVKSGGTPQYFFDFVDLIKRKGKDVSDRQAVVERQKVIEYKDYTLTDTDGYITIRKTDEDMGT